MDAHQTLDKLSDRCYNVQLQANARPTDTRVGKPLCKKHPTVCAWQHSCTLNSENPLDESDLTFGLHIAEPSSQNDAKSSTHLGARQPSRCGTSHTTDMLHDHEAPAFVKPPLHTLGPNTEVTGRGQLHHQALTDTSLLCDFGSMTVESPLADNLALECEGASQRVSQHTQQPSSRELNLDLALRAPIS
mmetsp:Transcript_138269/g.441854  ORF Transcript_138269/g.441854 Transcript_138269/m.441854 type:complete len:189 (-) Transcript_138269:2962-3528(-)